MHETVDLRKETMEETLLNETKESNDMCQRSFTRYSLVESDRFLSPNIVLNSTSAYRTPYENMARKTRTSSPLNLKQEKQSFCEISSKDSPQVDHYNEGAESDELEEAPEIDVLYEDSNELAELKREFFFSEIVELNVREVAQREQARLEAFHEQLFSLIPLSLQNQSLSSILEKLPSNMSSTNDISEYSRLFDFFMMCSNPLQHCAVSEARRVLEDVEKNISSLDTCQTKNDSKSGCEENFQDSSPSTKKWQFNSDIQPDDISRLARQKCTEQSTTFEGLSGDIAHGLFNDVFCRPTEMSGAVRPDLKSSINLPSSLPTVSTNDSCLIQKAPEAQNINLDVESTSPFSSLCYAPESVMDTISSYTTQPLKTVLIADER